MPSKPPSKPPARPALSGRRSRSSGRPSTGRPAAAVRPVTQAAATQDRAGDRIAKLLARAGIASRREIERMIAEGRIAIDGKPVETPATILKSLHGVTVDGNPVKEPAPARLFLFHKPVGYLTAERDPQGRKTIYDRLPSDLPRLVPVGRLDLNTEGLLLMTTDGGLKRQLELPATGVERTYRARTFGAVTQAQLEDLFMGIEVDGMRYGVKMVRPAGGCGIGRPATSASTTCTARMRSRGLWGLLRHARPSERASAMQDAVEKSTGTPRSPARRATSSPPRRPCRSTSTTTRSTSLARMIPAAAASRSTVAITS
jgi:pseudouridine synthase